MPEKPRIMIVAHGHPDSSPGGGENAAYALFRALRERKDVTALFVARAEPRLGGAALSQHGRDGSEVLLHTDVEFLRFSQRRHEVVYRDFRSLLEWFRPTVIHFHHYMHLGLELLREARNHAPSAPILLTLHEFLAMCYADGQMVKRPSGRLCTKAGPEACHGCFPQIPAQDFFLRETWIKGFFDLVDTFVSPSEFLMQRYIEWGLPSERFACIENGLPHLRPEHAPRPAPGAERRLGFFGQIQRHKGVDILLEAMTLLPPSLRSGPDAVQLDIHGSRLAEQPAEYRRRINGLLKQLDGRAEIHGAYQQADLAWLMARVGWVVMPSRWWENSPVVIQEAFSNGLPVICSDIGGMAEKVQDGVNGLHFHVGDPLDLADRITQAMTEPGLHERLRSGIPRPPSATEIAQRHVELYAELAARRSGARSMAAKAIS